MTDKVAEVIKSAFENGKGADKENVVDGLMAISSALNFLGRGAGEIAIELAGIRSAILAFNGTDMGEVADALREMTQALAFKVPPNPEG
jgi:hypothetical protein